MGEAARRYVAEHHDPARAAEAMLAAVEELSRLDPPGDLDACPPPPSSALHPRGAGEIRVEGLDGWRAGERRTLAVTIANRGHDRWRASRDVPGGVLFEIQLWARGRDRYRGRPWLTLEGALDPGRSQRFEISLRRPLAEEEGRLLIKPTVALAAGNRPFGDWHFEARAVKPGLAAKLLFAAGAAALGALALLRGPALPPRTPGQIELRLAVESLSRDGDLAYETRDADRFRVAFGQSALKDFHLRARRSATASPEADGVAARQAGATTSRAPDLSAPWPWARLAAIAHRLGGWPGVFSVQWSLLILGCVLATWSIAPLVGSAGAFRFVSVVLFASALAIGAVYLVPEMLQFALVAVAGAVVWGRRSAPTVEPEQVYGGDLSGRPGTWRWLVAGLCLGLVATGAPSYVVLGIPLVAAAGAGRRGAAGALVVLGATVAFGLALLAGGWPWPPLATVFDLRLLGWSAAGLAVGRSIGVLVLFLPLLLAFATPARDEGRRWIPWTVALAALLQLVTAPFDLAGDSGASGNSWFLPLAALLLFLPARVPAATAVVAVGIASWALLAPSWLPAFGLEAKRWARELGRPRALLPIETTQRELAGTATLDTGSGIAVRGLEPDVFAGGDGRLRLAGRSAALAVESATPLASLRLEFGADAPATFEVKGGSAGDVVLRPNGEVAVDVSFVEPSRTHPTWRSPGGASIYFLRLELERAPVKPLPFDVSLARPAGLGESAP